MTEGISSQKNVRVVCADSLLLRFRLPLRDPPPGPPGASPRRARARPDCAVLDDMAGALLLQDRLEAGLEGLQGGLGVGLAGQDSLGELVQCLSAVNSCEVRVERSSLGGEGLGDGLPFLDDLDVVGVRREFGQFGDGLEDRQLRS